MSFQNFQLPKSFFDKIRSRWWIFLFPLISLLNLFNTIKPPLPASEPKQSSALVVETHSARQQRVDEFCSQLPKPEKFDFVGKSFPAEDFRSASVSYFFRSSRPQEEIFPIFIMWFGENGWTNNKDKNKPLEFTKNNQTILISPLSQSGSGDYFIVCTEWKTD